MNLIIKNATFLLLGNFGARLITAFTAILLARYLDAAAYGMLSVALALSNIGDFFARMSLTHTMIREGKKPDPHFPSLFGGAIKLRLYCSVVTTLFFIVFIPIFYADPMVRLVTFLIVIPTIWGGNFRNVGEVYYQITEQMQYTALMRAVPKIAAGVLLLVAISLHASLPVLASTYGVSALLGGVLGIWVVWRKVPDVGGWHKGLLEGIGAFILGGILTLFLAQLGPLVLEKTSGLSEVGYFAVAYRIPAFLYTFPGALAAAFYPQLFHFGSRDLDQHLHLSVREIKSMTMIGMCLALPFAFYPEWVIGTFFGEKWVADASRPLAVLSWTTVLHCVNFPLADALTTQGLQRRRTWVLLVGVVVGLGLFIKLGLKWGAFGGAVAALSLEACLICGYALMNPARKHLLRKSIVPVTLMIIIGYAAGMLLGKLITFEPVGFILLPTIAFASVMTFDREVREQIMKIALKWRNRRCAPEFR